MQNKDDLVKLTVIAPCFNEEGSLIELHTRIRSVMESIAAPYEIILVDDGSTDGTRDKIEELCQENASVRGVILSRNFGKELAISAGLHHAQGDLSIILDSDLQHPPEIIPQMLEAWKKGAKIVTAIRENRETDGFVRRLCSRVFYFLFNMISEVKLNPSAGDYRLLDRTVVDVLNNMPERARFSKGLFSWIGFRQEVVKFTVADRFAGKPKFNFFKLVIYSISSLVSFSVAPIRVWFLFGLFLVLASMFYGLVILIQAMVYGIEQPGYVTTILLIILFGGVQMLSLGIFGEYIGRILLEVKARPQFIVMEELGVAGKEGRLQTGKREEVDSGAVI